MCLDALRLRAAGIFTSRKNGITPMNGYARGSGMHDGTAEEKQTGRA